MFRLFAIFVLFVSVFSSGVYALTPAGTKIINQAEITFFDPQLGKVVNVLSNYSSIVVAEAPALTLVKDQEASVVPAQNVNFSHILTNDGNRADRFTLSVENLADDDTDLKNLVLYHDSTENGMYDAGEKPITVTSLMQPGESIFLAINGDVDPLENVGKFANVRIKAVSQNAEDGSVFAENNDVVNLVDGAVIQLSNITDTSCNTPLAPNDIVYQEITFTNVGTSVPEEKPVTVENEVREGVLITSEFPHGFILESVDSVVFAPEQGQVVVMQENDLASEQWTAIENWDGRETLVKIALLLKAEQMKPNQSGKLGFAIRLIDTSTASNIIYSSAYIDENGDGTSDFESNQTCNSLADRSGNAVIVDTDGDGEPDDNTDGENGTQNGVDSAEIRFVTPSIALKQDRQMPSFYGENDFVDTQLYHLSEQKTQNQSQDYEDTWDGVYIEIHSTSLAEYLYAPSGEALTTTINLQSLDTGDTLQVTVMEVWPNSGIFRSLSPVILSETREGNNRVCTSNNSEGDTYIADYVSAATECVLKSKANDTLRISLVDNILGQTLIDIAVVDPYGRVFDSSSRTPIANAVVTIYDDNGQVAVDPYTLQVLPSQTTDTDGQYVMPWLMSGKYYVHVETPAHFSFPSILEADHFPSWNVGEYSYGRDGFMREAYSGVFDHKEGDPALQIDIPVDPVGLGNQIVVQKTASEPEVSVGSFVTYTIKTKNLTGQDLYTAQLHDELPYGFKYIPNSLRVNGEPVDEPEGGRGPGLTIWLGDFPDQSEHEIRYTLEVTAGAVDGDGINTAYVEAVTIREFYVESQDVHARVKVKNTGIFSDKAIIFGKVALEQGCMIGDAKIDGSYPIGGVKLYLEDGTYVITDGQGHYSLYGLKPGLRVIKVDYLSLPRGVKLMPVDSEHAGDPDSRFVDLTAGDFHRADFIAECPSPKIIEETCTDKEKKTTEWVTRKVNGLLKAVHFDSGEKEILIEDLDKLDRMMNLLKDKKNVRVQLVGHTDDQRLSPKNKKRFKTNQGLSEARAAQVAKVLKDLLKLNDKQVVAIGRGESQPIASNRTPQGMAQNRRVEIEVLYDEPVHHVTHERYCTDKQVIVSDVFNAIDERNQAIDDSWRLVEMSKSNQTYQRSRLDLRKQAGLDGDISSGSLQDYDERKDDRSSAGSKSQQAKQEKLDTAQANVRASHQKVREVVIPDPKKLIKTVTKAQAKAGTWVWPKTDTSLDGRFMVVVPKGVKPTLYVNGKAVSSKQLGEHLINKKEKAQVLAWYGVELNEGENTLKVAGKGPFGNERVLAEKTFKRPSSAASINVRVANDRLVADGHSSLPVTIRLLDKNGYLARGTYFVTLKATDGVWVEPDIQGKVPGHQVKISMGERTLHLRSTRSTGLAKIEVAVGEMHGYADFSQVSEIRPLLANGLIHIRARHGKVSGGEYLSSKIHAMAESELDARSAVFMKGLIKGGLNLTLSYDSDKDPDAELLRDIDPTQFYPVHGDSSVRGYEAQSRSKLYAKVEKDGNSVMWGDYLTDANRTHEDLSRDQRTLTGLNAVASFGDTRLQVFAANQEDARATEEFRGNGTAMNYDLLGSPIVANSEVIEIITRDRDNTGLIIRSERLNQFSDYTLDELTGHLSFHRVIPSVDEDLNPISIRAAYDREEDGDDYLVAGARVVHKFSEQWTAGVAMTEDQHELDGYNLSGGFLAYDNGRTSLSMTGAYMAHQDDSLIDGKGARVDLSHQWAEGAATKVTAARANIGFTSNGSGVAPDRQEVRITHSQKVGKSMSANLDVISSESLTSGDKREAIGATLTAQVDDWKLKGGARHIRQTSGDETDQFNTLIVGAERPFEILGQKGRINAEYEQETSGEGRKRVLLGGDYQVTDDAQIYGRYEIINSLSGITDLASSVENNRFILGVKTKLFDSTHLFSEYRLNDVISGRDLETASGIKGTYEIEKGLSMSSHLEVVKTLDGEQSNDSIAASIAIKDVRGENSRKLLRVETRQGEQSDYYGVRGSYAARIDDNWSALVREELSLTQAKNGDDQMKHALTLGAAHRPKDNDKHNALYMYQWKEARSDNDAGDTSTHVLSTHQHYQASEQLKLSGRVAAKSEKLHLDGADKRTMTSLMDGKAKLNLTPRRNLDLELRGGILATNGFDEKRYSAGAGVDFDVADNMRLGVGYNVQGFKDEDLDEQEYNAKGVYMDMKFKFDEDDLGFIKAEMDDVCAYVKDCNIENMHK